MHRRTDANRGGTRRGRQCHAAGTSPRARIILAAADRLSVAEVAKCAGSGRVALAAAVRQNLGRWPAARRRPCKTRQKRPWAIRPCVGSSGKPFIAHYIPSHNVRCKSASGANGAETLGFAPGWTPGGPLVRRAGAGACTRLERRDISDLERLRPGGTSRPPRARCWC